MEFAKPLLLNFFFLLLACAAKSQPNESVWIHGVGGVNSVWLFNQNAYGNQEMDYATTFGLSGGLGISYFKSKTLGFGGAIMLDKLGQAYSGDQAGANAKRNVRLTYIEVPLTLMRQVPYMRPSCWIEVGPDFMILTKAKQTYSREPGGAPLPNADGMAEGDITSRFKPVDIALHFSFNRMVELNYSRNMMFLFSINSTLGLLDVNVKKWQIPNTHGVYAGSHNFYIGVKAGMLFKVSRFKKLKF